MFGMVRRSDVSEKMLRTCFPVLPRHVSNTVNFLECRHHRWLRRQHDRNLENAYAKSNRDHCMRIIGSHRLETRKVHHSAELGQIVHFPDTHTIVEAPLVQGSVFAALPKCSARGSGCGNGASHSDGKHTLSDFGALLYVEHRDLVRSFGTRLAISPRFRSSFVST